MNYDDALLYMLAGERLSHPGLDGIGVTYHIGQSFYHHPKVKSPIPGPMPEEYKERQDWFILE